MKPIVTEQAFRDTYILQKFAGISIKKFGLNFPVYPNCNLAEIVSFLTFDGHLRWDGNVFIFTAGKRHLLERPKQLVKEEFGITGKFRKMDTNDYGTSYEYSVTNKPVSRILEIAGVPKGSKVLVPFSVPSWIKENADFARVYLQTAFDCEGSVWKEGKNRLKIRFRINKSSDLLLDGINFINELRTMLAGFGILTSEVWVVDSNRRKDGKVTKGLCFNVLAKSIPIFKERVGFNLKHKQKLLAGLCSNTGPKGVKL